MKLTNTAKEHKSIAIFACMFAAMIAIFLIFMISPNAWAKSADELNEEVSVAKEEYNELVRQQEELQSQIDSCNQQVVDLENEIVPLQAKLGTFAKEMYKGGDWLSVVNALFSSDSLDELIETVDALEFYMKDRANSAAQLKADRDRITDVKASSEAAKAELDVKVTEVEAQVEEVQAAYEEALAAEKREQKQYSSSGSGGYSQPNGSGLTKQSGVNYYNGRKETYYSSSVLWHYRTSEWTPDEQGFYHTSEGYYVVAASDMAQGTVFEGSKGMCQVLDSGCAAGTTDYYVNW